MFDIQVVEIWLREFSRWVPLELFVSIGSFLEEMISPIPAYLIMGIAGTIAAAQGKSVPFVILLLFLGASTKTVGTYFYYVLGDKLENLLRNALQRYFGIDSDKVEAFGKKFSGRHWQDGGIIFIFRAVPFMPSVPVSIAAGVFRMNLSVYLIASFLGNLFKDGFYIFAAYYGARSQLQLWRSFEGYKYYADILIFGGVLLLLIALYFFRGTGQRFWKFLISALKTRIKKRG